MFESLKKAQAQELKSFVANVRTRMYCQPANVDVVVIVVIVIVIGIINALFLAWSISLILSLFSKSGTVFIHVGAL